MSTYSMVTKHPTTGYWETALWIDDYFERHHYGVRFPDGSVFDPWLVMLVTNINSKEAEILNSYSKKND